MPSMFKIILNLAMLMLTSKHAYQGLLNTNIAIYYHLVHIHIMKLAAHLPQPSSTCECESHFHLLIETQFQRRYFVLLSHCRVVEHFSPMQDNITH